MLRSFTRKSAVVVTLASILLAGSACGKGETLKVGIDNGIKPFQYEEQGKSKGFDIDLWEAVAKKAGYKYEFAQVPFGEMMKAVDEGKVDVGIGSATMRQDRKKKVEFSTAYFDAGLALVVRNNQPIERAKDLRGKTVGTAIGTTGYDYISKIKGVKQIKAYPDIEQAYTELLAGKVDAIVFDEQSAKHFSESSGKGRVKLVEKSLTKEHYGIVLKKGSKHSGRINNALRELGKDGTYERIYVKWFDEKPKAVPGKKENPIMKWLKKS